MRITRGGYLKTLRAYLLDVVKSQTQQVVAVQKFFGLPNKHPVIHSVMFVGSCLGNEGMLASFFPILFLTENADMGRRELILWSLLLYIGQFLKDLLELPRPASPPVIRLEKHYETEYGLPSTHAFSSVCMSIYLNYYVYTRYENVPLWLCITIVTLWITSCCLSRLYLGVHSPIDVYVGLGLGVVLMGVFMRYIEGVDTWICQHNYLTVLVVPIIVILLLAVYPVPEKWNSSMGDTTRITAGAGFLLAAAMVTYPCQAHVDGQKKLTVFLPTNPTSLFLIIMRIIVGLLVLAVTRQIVKKLCYKYIPKILASVGLLAKAEEPGVKNDQRYATEIPCVYVTYGALAFASLFVSERIFPFIGLSWNNVRFYSGLPAL